MQFESLNIILHALPSYSPHTTPLPQALPTLGVLRDFLAHVTLQRAHAVDRLLLARSAGASLLPAPRTYAHAAPNGLNGHAHAHGAADEASLLEERRWPAYVRARALQTIAAVSKKALGQALEDSVVQTVVGQSQQQQQQQQQIAQAMQAAAAEHAHALQAIVFPLLSASSHEHEHAHAHESTARAHVGLALLRALLEEFGATPLSAGTGSGSGDDGGAIGGNGSRSSSSSGKGKGRAVEQGSRIGLTTVQHLLCKTTFQSQLYSPALALVLQQLHAALRASSSSASPLSSQQEEQNGSSSAPPRLHPLVSPAHSVLEGLLAWPFLLHEAHELYALAAVTYASSSASSSSSTTAALDLDASFASLSDAAGDAGAAAAAAAATLLEEAAQSTSNAPNAAMDDGPGARASRVPAEVCRPASSTLHSSSAGSTAEAGGIGIGLGLMSAELVELLAAAHRACAHAAAAEPGNSAYAVALHRSRQVLLLAFSLVDAHQPQAGHHSQGQGGSGRSRSGTQLEVLTALMHENQSAQQQHQQRSSLVAHANDLLFLAQAARTFVVLTPASEILESSHAGLKGSSSSSSSSSGLDAGPMLAFLTALAQLGHAIFGFAFGRSRQTQEEEDLVALAEETVDALLGCWNSLVSSVRGELAFASPSPADPRGSALQTIWAAVQQGLQSELVLPYIRGRIEAASIVVEEDLSEQGDETSKDRELYSDQLISIGLLARISAAETLRALRELLQPRVQMAVSGSLPQDEVQAAALWEQLHWLFLIAGHVLADGATGETPAAPTELASLAGTEHAAEAQLLQQIGVEAFCHFAQRPEHLASPLVMETWIWFTGRWAASYLLASSSGGPLAGEQGQRALSALVHALASILHTWTAETEVVLEVASTLRAVQMSETIPTVLVESQELHTLLTAVIGAMPTIPAGTHGKLLSSVVGLIFAAPPSARAMAEHYFAEVTQHIRARFEALVASVTERSSQQNAETILELQKVLDMLEGLAAAVQPRSAAPIFAFESQFFPAFNQLCKTYTGRAEIVLLVLRIYTSLAGALDLDYTTDAANTTAFNGALWGYLDALRDDAESLGLLGHSALDDEEPYEGLRRALDLIPTLAACASSSEVLGQQASGHHDQGTSLQPRSTPDVLLYAFITLSPKISDSALRTPSLALSFSAACADVTRVCAPRLLHIATAGGADGAQLLGSVVTAIVRGAQADSVEVVANALTGCKALANGAAKHLSQATEATHGAFAHLLQEVAKILLFQPVASNLIDDYILSLYAVLLLLQSPKMGGAAGQEALMQHMSSEIESGSAPQAAQLKQEDRAVKAQAIRRLFHAAHENQAAPAQPNGAAASLGGIAGIRAQQRAQVQAERAATGAFIKAVKPAVIKARSMVRVR